MASSDFMTLLQDLGERLGIRLEPDISDVVGVRFNEGTLVNFQEIPETNKLLVTSVCGSIGATGTYRESILKAALQANHKLPPRFGIFSYLPESDKLVLHETFDIQNITATGLVDYLAEFCFKASTWEEALHQGQVPDVTVEGAPKSQSQGGPGLFGLRP